VRFPDSLTFYKAVSVFVQERLCVVVIMTGVARRRFFMAGPVPEIVQVNGKHRLLVDGRPFLILGLQWDCDSCFSKEEMNPLFPQAAALGANTAALPVYWQEIEPVPDHYDFQMIDERLKQARTNGLRLVLLWFATWKNACAFYAPDYIRNDHVTYPMALNRNGEQTVSLCPLGKTTWQRDRNALVALMAHLRQVDEDHTVIMVQIENEPGLLTTDRCYCSACEERFAAEQWENKWGKHAAEAFSTASIAQYIDRLAIEARATYPLPLYVNVALPPEVGGIPGEYFSGGAVPEMLALAREHLTHIDLVAPDIYVPGYRDFHRLCEAYRADGNPLYIAEHSTSPGYGRAERNVFYALGYFGALGFDPWAIDACWPDLEQAPPLVDPIDGEWGPQARDLRDSYVALGRAIEPIVAAQGTERIFTCVQEPSERRTGWAAQGCDVIVKYHHPDGAGRGLFIQQSANEFLIIGVGFSVEFRQPRPSGVPIPLASIEWGRYEEDRWVVMHPMRMERPHVTIRVVEPGVARVVLKLS
jgi:hypothetical protein